MTYLQFSIDDTADIVKELTEKRPASVFQIERLAFLKGLHEQYGAIFSLYAFYRGEDGFTLSLLPDCYRAELQANADWLRWGAHSTDKTSSFATTDGAFEYERIWAALTRFAGEESLDFCFRPHFFVIDPAVLRSLLERGICRGVHCPDDDRKCHDFTAEEKSTLEGEGILEKDGLLYIKTQTRLENLAVDALGGFLEGLKGKRVLSIFTHECFLAEEETREKLRTICAFAERAGWEFAFPLKNGRKGIY